MEVSEVLTNLLETFSDDILTVWDRMEKKKTSELKDNINAQRDFLWLPTSIQKICVFSPPYF